MYSSNGLTAFFSVFVSGIREVDENDRNKIRFQRYSVTRRREPDACRERLQARQGAADQSDVGETRETSISPCGVSCYWIARGWAYVIDKPEHSRALDRAFVEFSSERTR